MGLFSHKPKISIKEFCRQFYDTQIFHPIIAGTDVGSVFFETVFSSVVEADQSFARVKRSAFEREMTALRVELFGLAWGHRFKQEKFTIPQSVFTRGYLEENGKLEVWDIMGEYNQAIAQSSVMTATGEQMGTAHVVSINKLRADMFDATVGAWERSGINVWDTEPTSKGYQMVQCVARVANRIGADIRRNDCILVKRLAARLAARLRCRKDLESEALFRLQAVIFGLYEDAMEAIKSVNLQVQ